ncbi:MAG: hypothetical protein QUS35_12145, partial [bacterium]|nr:hypothetical protein [bacterium]
AENAAPDDATRETVRAAIREITAAAFARDGAETDRFVEAYMKDGIGPDEWKGITVELGLGRIMEDGPRFREQSRMAVLDSALREMAGRNNRANNVELGALISRTARSIINGCPVQPPADGRSILEKTRTWKNIRSALEKDLASCASIISLLPGNPASLDQVHTLYKNPDMLEAAFTVSLNDAVRGVTAGNKSSGEKRPAGFALEIPPVTGYRAALDEMHKMRKALVLSVTGREDRQFFDDLKKRFDAVIARHTAGTKQHFFREEEKLRRRAEGAPAAFNEREFHAAKLMFGSIISLLDECGNKSVALVSLVSSSKKIASGEIVALSRHRARRDREYLEHLAGLVSECAGLPATHDPESVKRFTAACDRTASLFAFAGALPAPDTLRRPFLTRQDGIIMKELAAGHTAAVRTLKGGISAARGRLLRETASLSLIHISEPT